MAKVLVVTSGKGGVGKTTSTAALGAALAKMGKNVVVVDFDVGLRNLDLVMGAERRVVYDLINVVQGDAKLNQALIRDKRVETLHLLPASQTRDKDALTEEGVTRVMGELRDRFDWVICDSPAGIERGATLAMRHADMAVVVTNPEVSSVRDSDRIIGLLDSKTLQGREGREDGQASSPHPLRSGARRARRDAEDGGRARDPLDPAPRHHPGKRRGAARLECRLADHHLQSAQRRRARLCRRGEAAQRRDGGSHHSDRQAKPVRQTVHAEGRMNLFNLFRKQPTAPIARDRLQILLSHERTIAGGSDLVAILREEILAVIKKHVQVDSEKVQVKMERGESVSMLEVDIEIPTPTKKSAKPRYCTKAAAKRRLAACEPGERQAQQRLSSAASGFLPAPEPESTGRAHSAMYFANASL